MKERKKPLLIYDEVFLRHRMPSMHPESAERLEACVGTIAGSKLEQGIERRAPRRAPIDLIKEVHDPGYVDLLSRFGPGSLDPDTYVSRGTFEAACFAAGALVTAVDAYFDEGIMRSFCLVRPPGHHAEKARGMGFCIFNNVAVGAHYARTRGVERIMIADFDVHHGNGTQDIFYEDQTVFYFSTHQGHHYPGTGAAAETGNGKGAGYTCNVPLPAGSGDAELAEIYEKNFAEKTSTFNPGMIIVSAGYDLHSRDPLAGFQVTDEGVKRIVRAILRAGCEIPVIFSLEGGYDIETLARSFAATLVLLSEL